jgi:SAM-dependent methyltransferase
MTQTVEAERASRRAQVVEALADAVATLDRAPPIHVAVDGLTGPATRALADDVGRALTDRGRRCRRVTLDAGSLLHPAGPGAAPLVHRAEPGDDLVLVDGRFLQHPEFLGAWELVVFLREDAGPPGPGAAGRAADGSQDRAGAGARYLTEVDPEHTADVVVDLHDPAWPVIRRMDPVVAARLGPAVQLAETRALFAPRAAGWERHFPDDDPSYAAAVAELALRPEQTALDAGCGTGRALPHLRTAVGPTGHVLGFDLTSEMLAAARRHGRHADALLVLADARRLPLPTGSVDGGFAAGLLPHLPDPGQGLAELARVIATGGRLVLFHPSGRAALAARHGRRLREDDLLAHDPLRHRLQRTGWWLVRYDDGPDRFLAVAERVSPRP